MEDLCADGMVEGGITGAACIDGWIETDDDDDSTTKEAR